MADNNDEPLLTSEQVKLGNLEGRIMVLEGLVMTLAAKVAPDATAAEKFNLRHFFDEGATETDRGA